MLYRHLERPKGPTGPRPDPLVVPRGQSQWAILTKGVTHAAVFWRLSADLEPGQGGVSGSAAPDTFSWLPFLLCPHRACQHS